MPHPAGISGDPTPTAEPSAEPHHPSDPTQPCEPPQPCTPPKPCESQDPRIRRTRQRLQHSLAQLLTTREFERLSVHEITDAAGLNRATFYAHYPDKFALLECMVAARFHALLAERGIVFDGTCTNALRGIILGVCDFLTQTLTQPPAQPPAPATAPQNQRTSPAEPTAATTQNPRTPHLESAIVAVIRTMLLDGIRNHPPSSPTPPEASAELLAATASWAIYGAAREWLQTPNRAPSEETATTIQRLIAPLLDPH
jgi:AcrR family transcriptional regulator